MSKGMGKNMRPKISIVIPFHWMKNWQFFMNQCLESIQKQTFKDYEIILTYAGKMAENTNTAIEKASGELIKILYLDDYLARETSLQEIVDAMGSEGKWLITGCNTNVNPYYTGDIHQGNNKLGSPSVLTIRNDNPLLFDEKCANWLLDCDYYKRAFRLYGDPIILNGVHVNICTGDHQMTHLLTNKEKQEELDYLRQKYD